MEQPPNDIEATFVSHLLELRDRLLKIILVVGLIFAGLFPFANFLYSLLAEPLLAHMPAGGSLIAVEVITPFLTPLKLTLYMAVFVSVPFILYQLWSFVAPGLYSNEKDLAVPLLISSVVLFYSGVAFAYFIVFPLVFQFLVSVAPEGVAMMTDINKYLDFVLAMFFAFGLAFEVPVATIILIATGITDAKSLTNKRPYIIVGAFVIGMLLTPPDVISQIMLALPMWALFELGIIMSNFLIKPKKDADDEYEEDDDDITEQAAHVKAAAATASAAPTATAAESTVKSDEAIDNEHRPTGYSSAAYPDDFEPLSDEELEKELDDAEAWEEDNDPDEADEKSDTDQAEEPDEDNDKNDEEENKPK